MLLLRLAISLFVLLIIPAAQAQMLDCMVAPRQIADLSFGTSGVVEQLLVERGDHVHKGDTLGYLESAVEKANLAIAKQRLAEVAVLEASRAQLKAAKSKFERSKALESKQIMATSKFEEAEVEYENARLKVDELEEGMRLKSLDVQRVEAALSLRRIISPFDGFVVERHVSPGEYVENRKALTVAEINPVYADVIAPSTVFADVKKSQKVKITLQQPANLTVVAEAAVIDPYVDGASGTFRVRLAMANPDYSIVPGFRCRVELAAPGR